MEKAKKKSWYKKWWLWVIVVLILAIGSLTTDDSSDDSSANNDATSTISEPPKDTPDNKLSDLPIGSSVTIHGVTITVNSIEDGTPALSTKTYEVNVTYKNNTDSSINASPYDWSTVLHTGSDKAHVGGDTSFHTENIKAGKEWTGNVTLWGDGNPKKIQFESSFLNLSNDEKAATWLIKEKK